MKDREMILRLREIRQLREQRAQETVIRRQTATDRAARHTQHRRAAIEKHVEQTTERELAALRSMEGQPVAPARLERVRSQASRAASETGRLRDDERRAGAEELERKAELLDARIIHNARRKAVNKVDRLLEWLEARTARGRVAIAELAEEEERVSRRGPHAR